MIKLQRILTTTDFSTHSKVALQYAVEFARAFNAEVILTHVVDSAMFLSQLPPVGEVYFPPNIADLQGDQARAECERILKESGIARGRVVIGTGSPFLEIVRIATEEKADLIILGTHGRGAVAHMLLGSVAEKVVRKAPCPVLTVRSGEHEFVMP